MRLYAPFDVAAAIAFATAVVPFENFSISNTPIGPFHKIVFDFSITEENSLIVFSAISSPSHPSGTASTAVTHVLACLSNLSALRLSTGRSVSYTHLTL